MTIGWVAVVPTIETTGIDLIVDVALVRDPIDVATSNFTSNRDSKGRNPRNIKVVAECLVGAMTLKMTMLSKTASFSNKLDLPRNFPIFQALEQDRLKVRSYSRSELSVYPARNAKWTATTSMMSLACAYHLVVMAATTWEVQRQGPQKSWQGSRRLSRIAGSTTSTTLTKSSGAGRPRKAGSKAIIMSAQDTTKITG